MRIVQPSVEIISPTKMIDGNDVLMFLESVGRTCYKSEDKVSPGSAEKFVRGIVKNGHEAMIEHLSVSARIVCDRGVSHEIVRHRLASYAQESTRYCNYSQDKFGGEISVICPPEIEAERYEPVTNSKFHSWHEACLTAEKMYFNLLESGCSPQIARSVLPTCLKTEIVVTMNLREWKHFFKLRCSNRAHPQMKQIADMLLKEIRDRVPVIFDNIDTQET